MSIAYLSAAPGIPLQGPSGASAHIRDFVSALRRLDSVDLFVPQTVDRRGHLVHRSMRLKQALSAGRAGSNIGASIEKF